MRLLGSSSRLLAILRAGDPVQRSRSRSRLVAYPRTIYGPLVLSCYSRSVLTGTMTMSALRKWGVYPSLEETLQVLRAEEKSYEEIGDVLRTFSQVTDHHPIEDTSAVRKHPFIVVEGLDGCGKSTLVKKLSSRLQGVRMVTPGPKFQSERAFFDQQPNHLRRAYYSLCNYAAALEIRDILTEKPVILDRFWHSTAAYALAGSIKKVTDLPEYGHPVYRWPEDLKPYPDTVIFLKVDEVNRLKRLQGRSHITAEEKRIEESEFRALLTEAYQRMQNHKPKVVEVDANAWPKTVLKNVLDIISRND